MASPAPSAPTGSWNATSQFVPIAAAPAPEDAGVQIRPMGLKVHYTFDTEAKVNCLARYPHTLNIQTVPLDETSSIGIIDLRVCVQAITECSPELAGQGSDYTVYAHDYSEPDTPLVGQGMLSWALDSMRGDMPFHQPKMVTGRVTKNLLGVFGGGNKETLEVKLKLSMASQQHRRDAQSNSDGPQLQQHMQSQSQSQQQQQAVPMETALTPSGAAEWNSFIQSNPQIGQPAYGSRVASPALSQGHDMSRRRDSSAATSQQVLSAQEVQRVAPILVETGPQASGSSASSRPSSRTSNRAPRKKPPTGRPRGRPRKKPVEGNTSGYEDGTEGEDGPTKKRIKTTKVDKTTNNPFSTGPESLRVAASTAGSLRNFRPIAANNEAASANHLQEVPRAPTPVPNGSVGLPGRVPLGKMRRESTLSRQALSNFNDSAVAMSPSQDGRSPESQAPTPNYSQGSPADIGSSPPVQRTTPFIQSSPPASSPVLPPMPADELPQDVDFEMGGVGGVDELFGHDFFATTIDPEPIRPIYVPPRKPTESRNSSGVPIQVFQMQEGPAGHDLVHICSYNNPHPTSNAPSNDTPTLPPLKQDQNQASSNSQATKKKSRPSPPAHVPTPPPTTDTIDRAPSPLAPVPELPRLDRQSEESAKKHDTVDSVLSAVSEETVQQESSALNRSGIAPPLKPHHPRQLSRSQSAGPLALPVVPASEPVGPSSLSQAIMAEPEPRPTANKGSLKRSASTGPLSFPIPASDPVGPSVSAQVSHLNVSEPRHPQSDAPPPPSSPPAGRSNKNFVKKHAIKQRLEEAIMNGEMPPFCSNCGAIETPTWRKIWVQEHEGVPEYFEYSEKPGRVTAIEIVKRDDQDKPTAYRLVKKCLGSEDDKSEWQELLLCNPCGIWLTKCKCHRPRDRWDKDASRLGQERRKRGTGRSNSRSKKSLKDGSQINPTSEAYLPTDALAPLEAFSQDDFRPESQQSLGGETDQMTTFSSGNKSNPGSTHSRMSGTVKSPIDTELDEQLGTTKRLLFPSPKKDGSPKILCDLDVNIVKTPEGCRPKAVVAEKENISETRQLATADKPDDLEALFRSPAAGRPSTPPPNKSNAASGPFKTPTRPTPNHRPITRSVSRSLRSVRSMTSPAQRALFQRTPSKTPNGSSGRRRSPRNNQVSFDVFDTPISRSISQMFSEPNGFDLDNNDLDLSNLPTLEGDHGELIDFGHLLSTDAVMPSSPPKNTHSGFDYSGSANIWAQWHLDQNGNAATEELGDK